MNISGTSTKEDTTAELFRLLSQSSRLQILAVLGKNEACVCHLEAALGLRQAYISQQLMILRDGGLVTTHRDGRNIYYKLANPEILDLVRQASALLHASGWVESLSHPGPVENCPCPHCIAAFAAASGADCTLSDDICCDGREAQ